MRESFIPTSRSIETQRGAIAAELFDPSAGDVIGRRFVSALMLFGHFTLRLHCFHVQSLPQGDNGFVLLINPGGDFSLRGAQPSYRRATVAAVRGNGCCT